MEESLSRSGSGTLNSEVRPLRAVANARDVNRRARNLRAEIQELFQSVKLAEINSESNRDGVNTGERFTNCRKG